MKIVSIVTGMFVGVLLSIYVFSNATHLSPFAWVANEFDMPKSVAFDRYHQRYYVSNINGGVAESDGSVGLLDKNGKMQNADWVIGLHSPKGLALYEHHLYVADVGELVVIDVKAEKIIARYESLDSTVLDGVAINNTGQVFVSDWEGRAIYQLHNGVLIPWLISTGVNSPSGLWVNNTYLYVATWGVNPEEAFSTDVSGSIKRISLNSKKVMHLFQDDTVTNFDEIMPMNKHEWLSSDSPFHYKNTQTLHIHTKAIVAEPKVLDSSISALRL